MEIWHNIWSNSIVAFLIMVSLVVFIHELGHFLAGKLFGIQVEEFSIGFGPEALGFQWKETKYRINWLPLGGYVRFFGSDPSEHIEDHLINKSFSHAPVLKRAIVSAAGPFANFFLSFSILFLLVNIGIPEIPSIVSVLPRSQADKSGLKSGDSIISINEHKIQTWNELSEIVSSSPKTSLKIQVLRQSQKIDLVVTPTAEAINDIYGDTIIGGKIGVTPFFSNSVVSPAPHSFLRIVGLKLGDKILSVQTPYISPKKIEYINDIATNLENILKVNNDQMLAKAILNKSLTTSSLRFLIEREKKIITLQVNFLDSKIVAWAKSILSQNFYPLTSVPWQDSILSSNLTVKNFTKTHLETAKALEKCGLTNSQTIFALNHQRISQSVDLYHFLESSQKNLNTSSSKVFPLEINSYSPQGKYLHLQCNIPIFSDKNKNKTIAFPVEFYSQPKLMPHSSIHPNNFKEATFMAWKKFYFQISTLSEGLSRLLTGKLPLSNLGGPISVATLAGDAAKAGFITFLLATSFLSLNIGLVNLLPLPALDGGHIFFNMIEFIWGRKLPLSVQNFIQKLGVIIVISLFILVFYNDFMRLWP